MRTQEGRLSAIYLGCGTILPPRLAPLPPQPHSHYDTAAASRLGTVFDSVIQPYCLMWYGVLAILSKEVLKNAVLIVLLT